MRLNKFYSFIHSFNPRTFSTLGYGRQESSKLNSNTKIFFLTCTMWEDREQKEKRWNFFFIGCEKSTSVITCYNFVQNKTGWQPTLTYFKWKISKRPTIMFKHFLINKNCYHFFLISLQFRAIMWLYSSNIQYSVTQCLSKI